MGVNKLKAFMSEITAESAWQYTNQSLRATAVARMFNKGVPEKLIAEKSGYAYERTSVDQEKSAGDCLQISEHNFIECVNGNESLSNLQQLQDKCQFKNG